MDLEIPDASRCERVVENAVDERQILHICSVILQEESDVKYDVW